MSKNSRYYECHITIEPVFDERLRYLAETVGHFGFKVADLLMKKRSKDSPKRSENDTFLTGRSDCLRDMLDRMDRLLVWLQEAGYIVWRYKVEDTLLDVRCRHTNPEGSYDNANSLPSQAAA